MLFVSCGESAVCQEHIDTNEDNYCDTCKVIINCEHKDENNDNVCDTCAKDVVKIEVAGEISDLVVKPLPQGGNLTDYIITERPDSITLLAPVKSPVNFENINIFATNTSDGRYVIAYRTYSSEPVFADGATPEDEPIDTKYEINYYVYDMIASKVLASVENTYLESKGNKLSVTVSLENAGFRIDTVKTVETEVKYDEDNPDSDTYIQTEYKYETKVMTYSGVTLAVSDEEYVEANLYAYNNNGIYYVTVEDTTYAVDVESGSKLSEGRSDVFLKRPTMTYTKGDYGYVEASNNGVRSVYVYDLTKWIECIYVFDIPATAETEWFILDNGNVLIQSLDMLDPNARNYDVLVMGQKIDVKYTLVDLANKTASAVDFGYLITACENGEAAKMLYKDTAKNVLTVIPIKDRALDTTNPLALVVENDLTIKFACDPTPLLAQAGQLFIVADNRYVTWFKYGAGNEYTWATVNEKLEIVTYLPVPYMTNPENFSGLNTSVYREGFVYFDNKVYSFDMEVLMDFSDEDSYKLVRDCQNYFILSKTFVENEGTDEETTVTKYYHYDPATSKTPVEIKGDIVSYEAYYYVTKVTVTEPEAKTTYNVYDQNNKLILGDLEAMPSISPVGENLVITVRHFVEDEYVTDRYVIAVEVAFMLS